MDDHNMDFTEEELAALRELEAARNAQEAEDDHNALTLDDEHTTLTFTGLDRENRDLALAGIRETAGDRPVLLVTHDAADAAGSPVVTL